MRKVDVIIPTLSKPHLKQCLDSLVNIPFDIVVHLIKEGNSWPEAVNIGFSKVPEWSDVLLMDDDVEILPDTFKDFDKYYPHADIFGFRLYSHDWRVWHGGCEVIPPYTVRHRKEKDGDDTSYPLYVKHVCTSLCFIKHRVIEKQKIAEDYKGFQYEDVDFCFRAIDNGFRILYIPNAALHLCSATKKDMQGFKEGMIVNSRDIESRFDFSKYVGTERFDGDRV